MLRSWAKFRTKNLWFFHLFLKYNDQGCPVSLNHHNQICMVKNMRLGNSNKPKFAKIRWERRFGLNKQNIHLSVEDKSRICDCFVAEKLFGMIIIINIWLVISNKIQGYLVSSRSIPVRMVYNKKSDLGSSKSYGYKIRFYTPIKM